MEYDIPAWKKSPFIRILLPFILGILWGQYFPWNHSSLLGFLLTLFLFLGLLPLLSLSRKYASRSFSGIVISISVIVSAHMLVLQHKDRNSNTAFKKQYCPGDFIVAAVDGEPEIRSRSLKVELSLKSIYHNEQKIPCSGRLLLYISQKDSSVKTNLHYGDEIIFNTQPTEIKNTGNPGEFRYKEFLERKGIHQQVFLKPGAFLTRPGKYVNAFRQFLISTRQKVVQRLRNTIVSEREKGLAEALVIGYKADLDKDLVKAFSETGVVHIIAISGLHLGLIFMILLWLCNKSGIFSKKPVLKNMIIIIALWMFALLTGGSASVLRSALMFSLLLLGQSFNRKMPVINSLAASAFILLAYDPYLLWDIGFQLSYLALGGIIFFQKPISRTVYVKNKWLRKVWELASVSLGAQLTAFPLCLYYFHQFPSYFLLANLLAVPLSGFILTGAIIVLCISWMPGPAYIAGKILTLLIRIMNESISLVHALPYSSIGGIFFSLTEALLLYLCIAGGFYFFTKKSKPGFFIAALSIAAIFIKVSVDNYRQAKQARLIVYNVQGTKAIDFIKGKHYYFFGKDIVKDSVQLARVLMASHLEHGATKGLFSSVGPVFSFHHKKVLLIDRSLQVKPPPEKIAIDVLVISGNPDLDIYSLSEIFQPGIIVFDATNSLWKIQKWNKDCDDLHLPSYSVSERGAYITDL